MESLYFNKDFICIHREKKYYLMHRKSLEKFDLNQDAFQIISYIHDTGLKQEELKDLNSTLLKFIDYLIEKDILTRDINQRAFNHIKDLKTAPHLLKIFLEMTHQCNLHCQHCYSSSTTAVLKSVRGGQLSTEELKNLIDEAHSLGVWHFDLTGGEPFLRQDIYELLEYLDEKGMIVNIFTNLTLLDAKKIRKLKDAPISQWNVSFDAYTSEVHDKFRGVPGCQQQTIKNIKLLKDLGFNVQASLVIGDHNYQEIEDLIRFLTEDLGIEYTADVITPAGRGSKFFDNYKYAKLIAYLNSLHFTDYQQCSVKNPGDFEVPKQASCGVGENFLYISEDGQANLCPSLTYREDPEFSVGNIRETSLQVLWDKFIQKYGGLNCEQHTNCAAKEKCSGGCRSRAYAVTKSLTAPDMSYCIQFDVDQKQRLG